MLKDARQRWLIDKINQPDYRIPLKQLATDARCSVKTIRRDIEQLMLERDAPCLIFNSTLIRDKTKQPIELQGYWFNKPEIESLFALNQIIQQLSPGVLQQQIEPFQHRIEQLLYNEPTQQSLSQKIKLIEIAERQIEPHVFEKIVQALAKNKQLNILFWGRERDTRMERIISPQQLVRYKDNWKLDAWCHKRQSLRTFSLEAIESIGILSHASKSVDLDTLQNHFESSYGIFAGQATQQAVIQFSPYISRWVKFEQWHPKQLGTLQADGSYQLSIPYHQDPELIQDILKYGHHAKVLEPPELKEKIQQEVIKMQKMYAGTGFVPDE